jgi:tetratricopeptide (TPR) repeat protein
MFVDINNNTYKVEDTEFNIMPHTEYNNLIIRNNVGYYERVGSLLNELIMNNNETLVVVSPTHGGFLPIECSKCFKNVILHLTENYHASNINENITKFDIKNIQFCDTLITLENFIIFSQYSNNIDLDFIRNKMPILLMPINIQILTSRVYKHVYNLTRTDLFLYIPDVQVDTFNFNFSYFIDEKLNLNYDNLLNLCIMVKNGGPQFENMLVKNLNIIDRWTILDTGSTDNTIEIINKVLLGKKKGNLFQEPFINFKDSRNRCLDLAGTTCKFTCMLDDTYIIEDELRDFLNIVRGDQLSDSFSLYIKSNDSEYVSNRIVKTDRKLRYIYKIHESITSENNKNVIIPINKSRIMDFRCDYMEERTISRKEYDLQLLFKELDENPDVPRHLYYIAQTYNVMGKFDLAYEYYLKRINHPEEGFIQEKIDACFEAARKANFDLNKPWDVCEELYLRAYNMDKTRPDSLYFIGIHYKLENNDLKAFEYFKHAFKIGYPLHAQYSLKPTLSFHFLPIFLMDYCYIYSDFILGEKASTLFLQNNKPDSDQYQLMVSWNKIFINLNKMKPLSLTPLTYHKPYFCFVADGGFSQWTGRDILTSGVGGSETYIIEMARYIQQNNKFQTIVFCNCSNIDIFEGVLYYPLEKYFEFVCDNYIHTCVVSRFSEYLPVAFKSHVKNVYMVLHDLTPSGVVVPLDPKLKQIFCLTEWHVEFMSTHFPSLKHLLVPFYYGIDVNKFNNTNINKNPYKFIYSSFPNRGLLQLLQMWPKIYKRQPKSNLHIYSDINGKWVNDVAGDQIIQIKELLNSLKGMNIFYHGWVSKQELSVAWLTSDIWFYPCTFMETFCLTALEAALSKTLVVCTNLAALKNTVSNRGILIDGDPTSESWQDNAINILFDSITNLQLKNTLLNNNYLWAKNMSWENQANLLLEKYIQP